MEYPLVGLAHFDKIADIGKFITSLGLSLDNRQIDIGGSFGQVGIVVVALPDDRGFLKVLFIEKSFHFLAPLAGVTCLERGLNFPLTRQKREASLKCEWIVKNSALG
jgi:hypothetical protein